MPQYRNVKEFLEKIKKAHGQYRADYIKAADAYMKNKEEWQNELRRGWASPTEKQRATDENMKKRDALRQALEDIETKAAAKYEAIKKECMEIFEPYNRINPAHVDMALLELIKSGVFKEEELCDLANQCGDNITMLRLIGKHAESRAEGGKNQKMQALAMRCAAATLPYIEPIDTLIFWSMQDIRTEKDVVAKEHAIGKSNYTANYYEAEANKIIAKAEADNIYISIPVPGDPDYKS